MSFEGVAEGLRAVVGFLLLLIAIWAMWRFGRNIITVLGVTSDRVAEMEEADAEAGSVFKRILRGAGVAIALFALAGLVFLFAVGLVAPETGIGLLVTAILNFFLALFGLEFQFGEPTLPEALLPAQIKITFLLITFGVKQKLIGG